MAKQVSEMNFEFLDPARVRFFRGPSNAARLVIEEHDRSYLKVTAARAFPISEPHRYIGFLDGKDKDIGMIEDIRKLDPESKRIVEEELEKRYFMPVIRRIPSLKHEFDLTYFEVETDRGKRDFSVRGHSEHCVEVSPGRYIIEDVDGSRYEIPDIDRLDARSRNFLAKIL
jgi:hypothetical protein